MSDLLYEVQSKLNSKQVVMFLFGGKPAFSAEFDRKYNPEMVQQVFGSLLCEILGTRIWTGINEVANNNYYIYFSKKRINKHASNQTIRGDYETGKILGIPDCCIKKFVSEEDKSKPASFVSALRYINQLQELKIKKDRFGVMVGDGVDCHEFGFVPCSPTCPKALKIADGYDKIKKEMGDKLKDAQ